jgi:hypothetical protein
MKRLIPAFMVPLAVFILAGSMAAQSGGQFDRDDRDDDQDDRGGRFEVVEKTIPQLQAALAAHEVTSKQLVKLYLKRIKVFEGTLNAYITLNPHATDEAKQLDRERAQGQHPDADDHDDWGRARLRGIRPAL